MLKAKKISAIILCITVLLSMCVFTTSASKTEIAPYASATYNEVVNALPGEFPGPTVMSFTGSSLLVTCNAKAVSGSPTTVTIKLKKQLSGSSYTTVATGSVNVDGISAVVFNGVSITPYANYRIYYQVNGSNNPTAKVVTVAMS